MAHREIVYGNIENPGIAETHLHTVYGPPDDGRLSVHRIIEERRKNGVDVVSVTPHNDITPSFIVAEHFEEQGLSDKVVVGEEVTVFFDGNAYEDKHLIGLFLKKEIPEGLPAFDAVEQILDQDGIVIIPHPGNRSHRVASLTFGQVEELLRRFPDNRFGIEIYSAALRDLGRYSRISQVIDSNNESQRFFEERKEHFFPTGGSDTHFQTLGFGVTTFEGNTAFDLRQAMESGETGVMKTNRNMSNNAFDYGRHKVREFVRANSR